ncbi:peptidylprolyl isomerase family protein CPR8 KNAG_0D00420 [Huiozyma naganishii CBS 8797]|uniref:PPIase cyclophilin-type domain-containing protein n=1 Tax=Huiozyma naganishii (strain ATCC MYA-139 / BCRC 22969 / CBS 8797 / KCTC 17520 / NBRC 10181 / NCYC 3082 / Yp74L-3) TaxID=1071383 RepID=J7R4M2_HUIN7|nr:hypothetical protein KNAG_0D00420 [Kazachstania naganishii CBS 8797]CCK69795.1 hypothetical protein KNAG_0D00420 [Kazachstania naganishii CBS 8797]
MLCDMLLFLACCLFVSPIWASPTDKPVLDFRKMYPPDPPSSTNVLMGFRFYDEHLQKKRTVDVAIKLFDSVVPKTTKNFRTIAKGVHVVTDPTKDPIKVIYKGLKLQKVIPGDRLESFGVFEDPQTFCIYGSQFEDENFSILHDRPGRVSMVNHGEDSNESRFMIDLNINGSNERNGKNVVFGQVISGLDDLIKAMSAVKLEENRKPMHDIEIAYSVVDELKISNIADLEQAYKEDLKAYNDGQLFRGVSLGNHNDVFEKSQDMADAKFLELNHPLTRIALLGLVLGVFYLFMQHKGDVMKWITSTTKSMKQDSARVN